MSEHNYAGLLFKTNLEKHPEVFTITEDTIKQVQENQAARRAEEDKQRVPSQADFRKEYNQLRQQLFGLKQNATCYEIRTNEAAGKIRLLEQRIDDLLKSKKEASEAGNLRGERTYEQAVEKLETELLDVQEDFNKNRRWSGQAARALKEFNGHGRIEELKALLDGEGLPVAKTDK